MLFDNIYKNRSVFVTGHTGFKGGWLVAWLEKLGSKVCGYALDVPTTPNHFSLLDISVQDVRCDVSNFSALKSSIQQFAPEIVFHLAAQSLVPVSFRQPLETFAVNILGTAHVLEACRQTPSVRAVVIITSDKCYENKERRNGHQETDPLGGDDPYSASKACAEIVTASYRKSFSNRQLLIASCRSGNTLGGGDWAADRLIPDLVRSVVEDKIAELRMPQAIRPWQHVLNPLAGYLLLGQRLLEGQADFAEAWNFGPNKKDHWTVDKLARHVQKNWKTIRYEAIPNVDPRETPLLSLNAQKARRKLGWNPVWNLNEGIDRTISWYRHFYEQGKLQTFEQIAEFEKRLKQTF